METNFSLCFGNEAVRERLARAVKSLTLPHAFLITGKAGSGKKTLALELAMALNCENKSGAIPCHACNTCRRIKDGNYTDIYTLRREGSRATIGVEDVRVFKSSMMLSPVESDYKVYIIEEADKLTLQAQNALLTFLEEPPRNTYIILLASSADGILTTVKSRAQAIAMQSFEKEELTEYLCRLSEKARNLRRTNGRVLENTVMNADGAIGKALLTLEEGGEGELSASVSLTRQIAEQIYRNASYHELYSAMCALPSDRRSFISSVESLMLAVRDAVLCRFDDKCTPLFYHSREELIEVSKKTSSKRLLAVYDVLTGAIEDAMGNVGISSIITSAATKIKLL